MRSKLFVIASLGALALSARAAPPASLGVRPAWPRSAAVRLPVTVEASDAEAAARQVLGNTDDLVVTSLRRSLTGDHVRFAVIASDGTRVAGGEVSVHLAGAAPRWRLQVSWSNLARPVVVSGARSFDEHEARARTLAAAGGGTIAIWETSALPAGSAARAGWRAVVMQADPPHDWEVWIDGETGAATVMRDLGATVDGQGWVFRPNPITVTGDTSLVDDNDADTATLTSLREMVVLQGLDGSGFLRGAYVDAEGQGQRASEPSLIFDYTRNDDRFEEVMAYFHIDAAQRNLQSLGFTGATGILEEPFSIQANVLSTDNSYFSPTQNQIRLGRGGVDDGEDGDVIIHEYGHATHHAIVPGWGASHEAGALGEGWGDFLAATTPTGSSVVVERACVAPWDATAYSPPAPPFGCLRRIDGEKHWPEHMHAQVHDDGEIWSGSMYDLLSDTGLGDDGVLRLVTESWFLLPPDATFNDAALALLDADIALNGGANLTTIRRTLTWDGLLRDLDAPGTLAEPIASIPLAISASPIPNDADVVDTVTVPGATDLRLHFANFDMEIHDSCEDTHCDNVYLYDAAGDLHAVLGGNLGPFDSVVIPGDTVLIRRVSDGSVESPGFTIDRVDYSTTGTPPPDAGVSDGDADPGVRDADPSAADADPSARDADPSAPDAGVSKADGDGGCDCHAGHAGHDTSAAVLALALLGLLSTAALLRRRR